MLRTGSEGRAEKRLICISKKEKEDNAADFIHSGISLYGYQEAGQSAGTRRDGGLKAHFSPFYASCGN